MSHITIISIHGPTNSGKDTLCKMIRDRALGRIRHLKFADQLRIDTEKRLEIPQATLELINSNQAIRDKWEREELLRGNKCFKDWMILTAREYCATEPFRYVDAFVKAVSMARYDNGYDSAIIVSDCRKGIELMALTRLTPRLYCFRIDRPNNPAEPKALDGLLDDFAMPVLSNEEGDAEGMYLEYCKAMQTMTPWPDWSEDLMAQRIREIKTT
jgi:hypothetical protein